MSSVISRNASFSPCVAEETATPFLPPRCPNATTIGPQCNVSNALCDILQPCQNNAICNETKAVPQGYVCSCLAGFYGQHCEDDRRPCQPGTCRNQGEQFCIVRSTYSDILRLICCLQALAMRHRTAHSFVSALRLGKACIVIHR